MAEKLSQRAVNYRDGTGAKNCGNCDMYRKGPPIACTRVVGPIRENGLCNIWETKE